MTELMTIRQMCDVFDVTPRTLRFYEQKELLFPIRRATMRLFTRRDRARLKLILRGKRFGFSLEEIRQVLDLYDHQGGAEEQMSLACRIACEKLTQMERDRADLDTAIDELKGQLAWAQEVLSTLRSGSVAA